MFASLLRQGNKGISRKLLHGYPIYTIEKPEAEANDG
jgi:hypothetical protein